MAPTATPEPTEPPFGPTGPAVTARVTRVIDGDTIEVEMDGTLEPVRYIGIDTPETVAPGSPVEWMGPEATSANAALVEGAIVTLEPDVSERDGFGRLLRNVWVERDDEWLLVNQVLVAQGYAAVTTFPPDVRYADLLLAAQEEARSQSRGLWGDPPDPTPPPTPKPTPKPTPEPEPDPEPDFGSNCHPSYKGACLDPSSPDYDCAGGSGNGPDYVRGPIRVVGPDEYGLDRDGDGIACD